MATVRSSAIQRIPNWPTGPYENGTFENLLSPFKIPSEHHPNWDPYA